MIRELLTTFLGNDLCQEYKLDRKRLNLANKITLLNILDDNKTIYTKNNNLVQVIKLEGKDYSGVSFQEQEKLFEIRKQLFNQLSSDIKISVHYQRKQINQKNGDLTTTNNNQYIEEINSLWNKTFSSTFKTEIYLVVRLNLPIVFNKKRLFLASNGEQEEMTKINANLEKLEFEVSKIKKMLEPYNPKILKKEDGLISFWDYVINHSANAIVKENKNIGNILSLTDIEFDKKRRLITLHTQDGNQNNEIYCKVLALKNYPEETCQKILSPLLKTKRTFNIVQHIIPVSKQSNQAHIKAKINQAQTNMGIGFIFNRINDLNEIGEYLESGDINFHWHIVLIYVYANSEEELNSSIKDIQGALGQSGINIISEGISIELAYWSQFPDYELLNATRKTKISTENLSDFITFGTSLEGLNKCAFGDKPIAIFKTTQNTNYSFTFHNSTSKDALGHTMIIGSSGSGKTTLIAFLLINCLKYEGLKIIAFDSGNGLKIPINVFDGDYINIGADKNLKLNPLLLPDNNTNRRFLKDWISGLSEEIISLKQKKEIEQIIRTSYSLKPHERNLSIISAICGSPKIKDNDANLTAKIEQWLPDSQTSDSELFNSPEDNLSFNKRIIGFDMAMVLNKYKLLYPLSSYIFHSFNEFIRNNPCPHICFIDEIAQYLENETFGKFILKAVREWRKKNGVFIGATQEASVLTRNKNGQDMIKNLATLLLFPDITASPKDYIDNLGLTDREYSWIITANPNRQIMLKRVGGESVILNIDLSCLGNYINLFSSRLKDVSLVNKLKNNNSNNWIDQYLKEVA